MTSPTPRVSYPCRIVVDYLHGIRHKQTLSSQEVDALSDAIHMIEDLHKQIRAEPFTTMSSLREIHRRLVKLSTVSTTAYSTQDRLDLIVETGVLAQRIDELERESKSEPGTFHLNSSRSVAVGSERFNKDMTACPRGVKVQLLNPGKVAVYGVYDGDPQWLGWYPIPGAPE